MTGHKNTSSSSIWIIYLSIDDLVKKLYFRWFINRINYVLVKKNTPI